MKALLHTVFMSQWKRWALFSTTFFVLVVGWLSLWPIEHSQPVWSLKIMAVLAAGSAVYGCAMATVIGYPIERRRRKALEAEVAQLKNDIATRR